MSKVKPTIKVKATRKKLSRREYSALLAQNTRNVLRSVDEALESYGSAMLSVDNDGSGSLDVNICTNHWSSCFRSAVARYSLCNISALIEGLDKGHVGYCF